MARQSSALVPCRVYFGAPGAQEAAPHLCDPRDPLPDHDEGGPKPAGVPEGAGSASASHGLSDGNESSLLEVTCQVHWRMNPSPDLLQELSPGGGAGGAMEAALQLDLV
ncbi:uncharacterized protein LOC106999241 [Macaca mulatta]